jgi:hypothetical protein
VAEAATSKNLNLALFSEGMSVVEVTTNPEAQLRP